MFGTKGLVKLPHPIQFSPTVRPTKLPANCDDIEGGEVFAALGIGPKLPNEQLAQSDKKLRQGLFKSTNCARGGWIAYRHGIRNTESLICTRSANRQMTASGDSGKRKMNENEGFFQYTNTEADVFK